MPELFPPNIPPKGKLCLYCKQGFEKYHPDQLVHDECQEALHTHNLVIYNNTLIYRDDAQVLKDLEPYIGNFLVCADNITDIRFEHSQQYNIDALYYTGVGFRTESWHVIGLNLWSCVGGPNYRGKVGSPLVLKALYESIPESLKNLHCLQYLDLTQNLLTDLPEFIGELKSLQILRMPSNNLSSLPECIGNLSDLQQLYLGMNKFSTFPEILCDLPKLERLAINNNTIASLPECIDKLHNLEFLWLNSNHITTLPESLGNVPKLKLLWLQNNQITTLPETFGYLSNLRYLGLEANPIEKLPMSFTLLSNLERLGQGNWKYYLRNPDWNE